MKETHRHNEREDGGDPDARYRRLRFPVPWQELQLDEDEPDQRAVAKREECDHDVGAPGLPGGVLSGASSSARSRRRSTS